MHHRHGDFGRRLSDAERLEIRRLVRAGEPYRVAAKAVGTTVKTGERAPAGAVDVLGCKPLHGS